MNVLADAAENHLEQWLEEDPQARLLRLFVAEVRNPRVAVLEVIAHELHGALFEVSDDRIAQAKLAFWLDEFAQRPRHPLTRALADASGEEPRRMPSLLEAAAPLLRLAQVESIESLEQILDPLASTAAALARARGCDFCPPDRTVAAARLVFAARDWLRFGRAERAWLPLDLLARFGLDRSRAAGSAVLARAFLDQLGHALFAAPNAALRGVDGARVAVARRWWLSMRRQTERLVAGRFDSPQITTLFALWRVGRRSNRT